jgi:glutaredoxin-related protein
MSKYRIVNFFIFLCVSIIACQGSATDFTNLLPERPRYYMAIGNAEMNLRNKSDIAVGGDDWGGSVIIYINDNPMKIMAFGGILTYLTFYIRPGENTISLKGSASKSIYIKIFEMSKTLEVKKVLFADMITPDKVSDYEKTVYFDAQYTPDFYFGTAPLNNDKERVEIKNIVKNLYNFLKIQNKAMFNKVATEGAILRSNMSKRSKSVKQLSDDIRFFYFSKDSKSFYDYNEEDLKIVPGVRTVLVYCDYYKDFYFNKPYLFKFKKIGWKNDRTVPPVILSYVKDRWIVWDLSF